MLINAWLSVRDDAHADIIAALEWNADNGPYDGPITEDQRALFARMVDPSAVIGAFKKNKRLFLWSCTFDFSDTAEFESPVIELPDAPVYPEWTGGERPEYPVEPIPTDDNGFPLFSRAKIRAPKKLPIPDDETDEQRAEREAADRAARDAYDAAVAAQQAAIDAWEATPEFAAWQADENAWKQADKDWNDARKVWQREYEAIDKPYRQEIANRKAVIRKQSKAFDDTDKLIKKVLGDLPNKVKLLGAWFSDGGQAMELDKDLLEFMPDVFDGLDNNGDPKFRKATEVTDVNLLAGQSPRDFDS